MTIQDSLGRLKAFDLNNDNKVTMPEVQLMRDIGRLGTTITAEQAQAIYNSVPPQLRNVALEQLMIVAPQLQLTGNTISTPNNQPVSVNLDSLGTRELGQLAADVLDGNNTIAGIDQSVADHFLSRTSSVEGSIYDPNGFNFNPSTTVTTGIGPNAPSSVVNTNLSNQISDGMNPTLVSQLRSELCLRTNTSGQTFQSFLQSRFASTDINQIMNSMPSRELLPAVRDFVAGMPPDQKARFVNDFMTAGFVHTGDGVNDTNVTQTNFMDHMDNFPKDPFTNRRQIDCVYFSNISQYLLTQPSATATGIAGAAAPATGNGITSVRMEVEIGGSSPGMHEILVTRDPATDPPYRVFSNNQSFPISNEQLRAAGWNGNGIPSNAQLGRAASRVISQAQFNNAPVTPRGTFEGTTLDGAATDFNARTLHTGDRFRMSMPGTALDRAQVTVISSFPPESGRSLEPGKVPIMIETTDGRRDYSSLPERIPPSMIRSGTFRAGH